MYPANIASGAVSDKALNNAFGGGAYVFACNHTGYTGSDGAIACGGLPSNAVKNQFFGIAMSNLGREACVSLLSSDWGTDGLVHVEVVGGNATGTKAFPAAKLPINMITAGSACPKYGSRASIVWTYY